MSKDEEYFQALAVLCGSPATWDALLYLSEHIKDKALAELMNADDMHKVGKAQGKLEVASTITKLKSQYDSWRLRQ